MTAKKQLLSYALCKTKWKPEIFVVQSPDAHVVSCNRGGVERRHAAWDAREPVDAAFEILASFGPPGDKEHAIDSTIVRAHQHAAGVKGGIKIGKRSVARAAASRPKSTSARTPKATR